MRHFLIFDKHDDYIEYKNNGGLIGAPNVSICRHEDNSFSTNDIVAHYIETPKNLYFTVESLEDNNVISFMQGTQTASRQICVSTDDGETWTEYYTIANSTIIVGTINTGQRMLFKGINDTINTGDSATALRLITSKLCNVLGNLHSLLFGDDFKSHTVGGSTSKCFSNFLAGRPAEPYEMGAKIVDASNLILINPASTSATYYYQSLFARCYSLLKAPKNFPTTIVSNYQYYYMFYGCSGLLEPPKLPATELTEGCYQYMFYGCHGLKYTPELPAMTLATKCYEYMFYQCYYIKPPEILPATNLAPNCYGYMFYQCEFMTYAPELPATTLANFCYYHMFQLCIGLINAPKLPATTLCANCYESMFQGCNKLISAPILPAETLADNCYKNMFNGCSVLQYINCQATDISAATCLTDWVKSISSSGTFIKNISMDEATWPRSNSGIPSNANWIVTSQIDSNNKLTLNANTSASPVGYITFTSTSGKSYIGLYRKSSNHTLYASKNGTNWMTLTANTGGIELLENESLYVYGTLSAANTTTNFTMFGINGSVKCGGNIKYLFGSAATVAVPNYGGSKLFFNCHGLVDASELLFTELSLGTYAFDSAFNNCTSLILAPNLPAINTSVNCYQYMFHCCTSLTNAPEILSTTIANYCYSYMFSGCTSLINPPELPIISLGTYCYQYMFYGCKSLKYAPELPSLTLNTWCYGYMFAGCHSLVIPPELPSTSMKSNCYNRMFMHCTSLKNMPNLSATTLNTGCYSGMFQACYNLKKASILSATTISEAAYQYMFNACFSLTTPPDLSSITSVGKNGCAGMFQRCKSLKRTPVFTATTLGELAYSLMFNWCEQLRTAETIQATTLGVKSCQSMFQGCVSLSNIQSSLPVTNLTSYCYQNMFNHCESLVTAPSLPTTSIPTAATYCYDSMFARCSNLIEAPELPATILSNYCYQYMFFGCSSLIEMPELPAMTLTTSCYRQMFYFCRSLEIAHELPATTLAPTCYQTMFHTCTSLKRAQSILPATTLTTSCYNQMFYNCTSLLIAPVLPAVDLVSGCYNEMFRVCSKLICIKAMFITTPSTSYTNNWMYQTTAGGTFIRNINATWTLTSAHGTNNWKLETDWPIEAYKDKYLTIESLEDGNVIKWLTQDPSLMNTINVSIDDGSTWTTVTPSVSGTIVATLNTNEKALIKANNTTYYDYDEGLWCSFSTTNNFNISGNIMSLIHGDNFINKTTLTGECSFGYLFEFCNKLISATNLVLPATTLTKYCYEGMFNNCTSLVNAPKLPATQLVDYCYGAMFYRCLSLIVAPELPATTLGAHCYENMFYSCTSLVNAPKLPATTLANYCYTDMFNSCTSLVTSPILSANTLTNYCYGRMFKGCTSLNYIICLATNISASNCLNDWVSNVAASGTFVLNPDIATIPTGNNGIPSGWESVDIYDKLNIISMIDGEWNSSWYIHNDNLTQAKDIVNNSLISSNLTDYSEYIMKNYIKLNNNIWLEYNNQAVFTAINNKAFTMEMVFNFVNKANTYCSLYALGQNESRILWQWGTSTCTSVAYLRPTSGSTSVTAPAANATNLYKIIVTIDSTGDMRYNLYNLTTNTATQTNKQIVSGNITLNPAEINEIYINNLPGSPTYKSLMNLYSLRFYNKTLSAAEIVEHNTLDIVRFKNN